MKKKICIVIPAYNEATVISDVVRDIKKKLDLIKEWDSVVAVVNDHSSDATSMIASDAGAIVINHVLNSGAGGATSTGLKYAKLNGFDVVATMDADGQHASDDVVLGIKTLINGDYDFLIGSRMINIGDMSRVKQLGNKSLSMITQLLFGVKSTDSQSGLRIFSKRAIDNLRWKATGFEFCSEMLWRAHRLKLAISEYPIKTIYTDYSKSKGQNNWNGINILKRLVYQRIMEVFE